MAKEKERKTAEILYVEQGKSGKEIAELLDVSEVTISSWVLRFGWKEKRTARNASPNERMNNIKLIITDLSERRLKLGRKVEDAETAKNFKETTILRKEIWQIDDAVSKWNKTLESMDKESKVSLSSYIWVMEEIFSGLRNYDAKLYMQTVDFQESHIQQTALKMG